MLVRRNALKTYIIVIEGKINKYTLRRIFLNNRKVVFNILNKRKLKCILRNMQFSKTQNLCDKYVR